MSSDEFLERFERLRALPVVTAAQALAAFGPPVGDTVTGRRRMMQWRNSGYAVALHFDQDGRMVGAGQEYSAAGPRRNEWLRVILATAFMVIVLLFLVDPM